MWFSRLFQLYLSKNRQASLPHHNHRTTLLRPGCSEAHRQGKKLFNNWIHYLLKKIFSTSNIISIRYTRSVINIKYYVLWDMVDHMTCVVSLSFFISAKIEKGGSEASNWGEVWRGWYQRHTYPRGRISMNILITLRTNIIVSTRRNISK